ncbi:hypothetical protein BDZ45DRAFT_678357 [Acephala macrosclerotiorum]|nr:hypothetical protein BDZ45DRAFT_678357 [Acephala macrosclerotiorum]
MASPAYDWNNAEWDSIPAYRLSGKTVNAFLQSIFGYYNFYTKLSTDHYQFWIPVKLTQEQRAQLLNLRTSRRS